MSSQHCDQETIVALASGRGKAGVAVIRVSGSKTAQALSDLCLFMPLPDPRVASLRVFVDPRTGEKIDQGIVLWFPAPNSFTGEDVAEFHVHGGPAVIKALLGALCSIEGVVPAEPGAFSRRAFENGKLDLTEAEAIADLVEAETAVQRRQALRQMDGELGRLYYDWAERLKQLLAFIEAEIDFADEDLPPGFNQGRADTLAGVSAEIETHINDDHRGEKIREGFMIALLGAPNAGKSTLLNALTRREAAIVAPTPGTTRDIIEAQLDLEGYPVTLADTAGLREAADAIENEGVRRALSRAQQADLKILLFDGAADGAMNQETLALCDDAALIVVNKMDTIEQEAIWRQNPALVDALFISAKTGRNMATLTARIVQELDRRFVAGATPALTRVRHRKALEEALGHLMRAQTVEQTELCAEDIRLAVRALGRITGRVDVEDVLDVVFSSFCIGK